ncbi:protein of unknown function [Tepidibacter aestuarii]|nr:protein of unknown function [Tepidibacter aestuarii]
MYFNAYDKNLTPLVYGSPYPNFPLLDIISIYNAISIGLIAILKTKISY